MNNLSSVSDRLQKSLNRLSSGSKIVSPADDAGGLAVSMKMGAAIKRQAAVRSNISNTVSYLQTQDGALKTASRILDRISELKALSQDVTKNATDISNYNTEFTALRSQLSALAEETFNGISLFSTSSLSVSASADSNGSSVSIGGVDLLGVDSALFSSLSDSFDNFDNFTDASAGTATATVSGGDLNLNTGINDLAQVDSNLSVSGPWELNLDFDKTAVVNDDLKIYLGGAEIFSYAETNTDPHSLRIVFDGSDTAEVYLDGSGSPVQTNTGIGSDSGSIRLQLNSTVSGASANIDNFSISSSVTSNDTGSVSNASDLSSLAVSTITDAIQEIASFRAQNGAQQSRLEFAQEQLTVNQANLEAANSRIVDVDVATESTQLARFSILQQAGAAMLSQANQSQQIAMRLLA